MADFLHYNKSPSIKLSKFNSAYYEPNSLEIENSKTKNYRYDMPAIAARIRKNLIVFDLSFMMAYHLNDSLFLNQTIT